MAFRANKWGWKATAARLLLAPVAAAGLAVPAVGQPAPKTAAPGKPGLTAPQTAGKPGTPVPTAGKPVSVTPGKPGGAAGKAVEPKELLRMGREALKAGRYDEAIGLARQADSGNAAGKWGWFDDTPDALEKDVRAARGKADKATAVHLTAQAKTVFAQSTQVKADADKLTMLNQAYELADRAAALQGETGMFEDLLSFSKDDPAELKKTIDAVRIPLRKKVPASEMAKKNGVPGGTQTASASKPAAPVSAGRTATTPNGNPIQTVSHTTPANAAAKAEAAKMVAEGRKMMRQGQLVEAKAKAGEALRLKATFAVTEDSPDALMRDVLSEAKKYVEVLTKDAQTQAKKKDLKKADAAYTAAREVAAGMGFPTRTLDEQHAAVRKSMGMTGPVPPAELATAIPKPTLPADAAKPVDLGVKTAGATTPTAPAGMPVVPAIPVAAVKTEPTQSKEPVAVAAVIPPIGLPTPPPASTVIPTGGQTPTIPTPSLPSVPNGPVTPVLPPVYPDPTPVAAVPVPAVPVAVVPSVPAIPTVAPTGPTGAQLLARAEDERQRGELEMATKLAAQAYNADPAAKDEAQAMLRQIDADKASRRGKEASTAFKNAVESANAKQYEQALGVLRLIDADSLPPDQKAQLPMLVAQYSTEAAKQTAPAVVPPAGKLDTAAAPTPGLADQVKALGEVEFQKFRAEALDAETKARAAFDRGETDLAIQMLTDFTAKVKGSNLSPARQNMLLGPIARRQDTFTLMKRQMDFYTKEAADKKYAKEQISGRSAAEQQKKEEIQKKAREVNELVKDRKYREAESLALQLKTLDPDDPAVATLYELAKRHRAVEEYQKIKDSKEETFRLGLNDAENQGVIADLDNPVRLNIDRMRIANARGGDGAELYTRSRTAAERQIELKLDRPYSFDFSNKPLREVIGEIRAKADVNITTDDAAIADEHISLDQVAITESVKDLSLRNVMTILLDKARLKYVVENDTIRVTTDKKAKGRLATKVFSVMELVTPVPDFALADHQDINKVLHKASNPLPPWAAMQPGGVVPQARGGLDGGELVSSGGPGLLQPGGTPFLNGGSLQSFGQGMPVGSGGSPLQTRQQTAAQLQKLITGMVRPYSWQELGGPGKLDYYDIGGALVVNQTADVLREVQDLLDALRRLQDLSMTVEVRLISLSETFFERVGVDFQVNLQTLNTGRDGSYFERALTTGQFRPAPYVNSTSGVRGVTVGWNPTQGGFTPDLMLPIGAANSYGLSVPPFGGYNGPTESGGLGLGLAFLNDVQVFMFLEAAQGDRRVNVMQAPKITLFNGQTSTVSVNDTSFFTTGLSVFNVGGQIIYLPQNTPTPTGGVTLTIQGVVTADRKFVRLTMQPTLNEVSSAVVPLFPVTAFITPVFEGGSQGVPIPFTQFFQQPSFTTINVQTTVQVPDGGTVVLGGLKTLAEGRNEFGPPVVSSIPYLNRLFRNQGIGRETKHLMIMVTPRIVINSEEELVQTGQGGTILPLPGGAAGPAIPGQ